MRDYGIRRGLAWVFLASILLVSLARAVAARDGNSPDIATTPEDAKGVLLLVREWDPRSGELVGWMPMHRVALTLQHVDTEPVKFDVNECVTINLPYRPRAPIKHDELRVAPETKSFAGRSWLPVQRDINIVHIRKSIFYVKSIVFGESKLRSGLR